MTRSSMVYAALAALWMLDGLRLRGRARSLAVLAVSDEPASADHRFFLRPGVTIDEATRRAASAFARAQQLEALDLIPANLSTWRTLLLLHAIDPVHFRKQRLAKGQTAGNAMLVSAALLERMGHSGTAPTDALGFAELALKVKQHACTQTDLAIAPSLRAAEDTFRERGMLVRKLFSELAAPVVLAQIVIAMTAPFFSPLWGLAALVVMHLQGAMATLGTALAPRDRLIYTLFRTPIDLLSVLGGFKAPASASDDAAAVSVRRPVYETLLAGGTAGFFESRRDDCPLCASASLGVALSTSDHYQFKPGRFVLERCHDCGHVFQNPRLSLDGLNFYYRDFYDGLGEERLEGLFSFDPAPYIARAKALDGNAPTRWLDVGAGHGHFCCVARDVWPEARFDGLDLSESIEHAAKRNWVDKGYRGLFPDLAPAIAEQSEKYDVVSMSHYLEHTRDPRAEIQAAAKVLPAGGMLMIEVPDPESRLGRLLGSYWVCWFQPQHQHFLSTRNLEQMLRANDFEPVLWHRGEAHQMNDFTFFTFTLLGHLARPLDLPWRAPTSLFVRAWHRLVWWAGIPFMAGSWILDRLLGPFLRREGWSNTYRVLARRTA